MSPVLPSLDEPPLGTACDHCGLELRILGFCPECHEAAMQKLEAIVQAAAEMRQRAIKADHDKARKRARTWQLAKAVRA